MPPCSIETMSVAATTADESLRMEHRLSFRPFGAGWPHGLTCGRAYQGISGAQTDASGSDASLRDGDALGSSA